MKNKLWASLLLISFYLTGFGQNIDSAMLVKELNSVENSISYINYKLQEQYNESKAHLDTLHETNIRLEQQLGQLLQTASQNNYQLKVLNDSIRLINNHNSMLYNNLINNTRKLWWIFGAFVLLFGFLTAYLILIRHLLSNFLIRKAEMIEYQNSEILDNTNELFKVKKTLKGLRAEQKKLTKLKLFTKGKRKK